MFIAAARRAPRCIAVRTATRRIQLPRAATTAPRRPKLTPPRRSFLALPQGEALPVVGGLIGANCLVYGAWQVVDPRVMTRHFTLSNDDVLQYPHTLVTSFFSHASGWHLLGNMVTLFFFAPEAIGALGAARFLAVYGGAGLVANGAQLAQELLLAIAGLVPPARVRFLSPVLKGLVLVDYAASRSWLEAAVQDMILLMI